MHKARGQLKRWAKKAIAIGMFPQLCRAMRAISHLLETQPSTWGDPQYHLPNMDLLVYRGFHRLFYVVYAVDEMRRFVYVREFRLHSGHPLEED